MIFFRHPKTRRSGTGAIAGSEQATGTGTRTEIGNETAMAGADRYARAMLSEIQPAEPAILTERHAIRCRNRTAESSRSRLRQVATC